MRKEVLYTTAARTATPTTVTIDMANATGLYLIVDITAVTATPIITPRLRFLDAAGNKAVYIWAATATIGTVATFSYYIGPHSGAAGGGDMTERVDRIVPDDVVLQMLHGDADSATYTVGAVLVGG